MKTPTIAPSAKQNRQRRFAEARGCSWGLWHDGKKKWLQWPLSNRIRAYDAQGEAAAAKIQMTRGKRDVMTNWFRVAVKVRRLKSYNTKLTGAERPV